MDIFTELVTEICAEEGIAFEPLSYGWILQLRKNGLIRHITGRHFDINGAATDIIACDKYACSEVLKSGGVPTVEHRLLFNPLTRANWIDASGEWERALAFFHENGQQVVVKPNNGWQGRDVYLCETPKAMERAISTIFANEPNACLCPFYTFEHEFRAFYVNGACRFAYGKERAAVTGDGVRSIAMLAEAANVPEDSRRYPYDSTYVPAVGEQVRVSWKHNLSNGAAAFEINDDTLRTALYTLAERAAHCTGIRFATVDMALLRDGSLIVMEINAGVTAKKLLEQHPHLRGVIKSLYAEALRAMMEI